MIEYWIELLRSLSILTPLLFHLVGTKVRDQESILTFTHWNYEQSDLGDYAERRVSFEEGIALAEKYSISSFVETSARDGTGVNEAFQQIITGQ
jgi:hypothetical protein